MMQEKVMGNRFQGERNRRVRGQLKLALRNLRQINRTDVAHRRKYMEELMEQRSDAEKRTIKVILATERIVEPHKRFQKKL